MIAVPLADIPELPEVKTTCPAKSFPIFVYVAPTPTTEEAPKVTLGILTLAGICGACHVAVLDVVAVGMYPTEGVPVRVMCGGISTTVAATDPEPGPAVTSPVN